MNYSHMLIVCYIMPLNIEDGRVTRFYVLYLFSLTYNARFTFVRCSLKYVKRFIKNKKIFLVRTFEMYYMI